MISRSVINESELRRTGSEDFFGTAVAPVSSSVRAPLRLADHNVAASVWRMPIGKKHSIIQWIAIGIANAVSGCGMKTECANMLSKVATTVGVGLSIIWWGTATLPAYAEEQTITTQSGDIGLKRSDALSELAIRARELFEKGMHDRDARRLAAAAEIMNRLSDVVDLRTDETAPPLDMDPRSAAEGERRTSGLVPILMTPTQIIDIAMDYAREKKDEALVKELNKTKKSMPKKTTRPKDQKSCVWANCCGRWGCWRWCQWW